MARPEKTDLRDNIKFAVLEAKLENPLFTDAAIHNMVAAQQNLPIHTIRYYLRRSAAPSSPRVHYSDTERQLLCSMSRKELIRYAAEQGKNFNTLYAMVWRRRSKSEATARQLAEHVATLEARGYLDFTRAKDLHAFDIPRTAFKDAQKAVKGINELDLAAPNYLVHRRSCKYYRLNLSEQQALLDNPRLFIKNRAQHISANWVKYHPNGFHFVLLDVSQHVNRFFEGVVVSTHETLESATQAEAAMLITKPESQLKVRETFGDSRSPFIRHQPGEWFKRPGVEIPISTQKGVGLPPGPLDVAPAKEPYDPWTCGVEEE